MKWAISGPPGPGNPDFFPHFQTATLSWDPVDCATSYEVVVRGVGGDSSSPSSPPIYRQVEEGQTQVRLDELEPCSSYEVAIAAYLGDEAGEYTGRFATRSVKNIQRICIFRFLI